MVASLVFPCVLTATCVRLSEAGATSFARDSSMPKTKGNAAGQYQDTVYFANREAKEKFDQVVLKEYEDYIHQPTVLERREQGREECDDLEDIEQEEDNSMNMDL